MTGRIVLLLLLVGGVAQAKGTRAQDAQKLYDAGVVHYKSGDYAKAVEEFEAAYEIRPASDLLFNLGSACRLAKLQEKAIQYYRKYLVQVPEAANRPLVEQRIAEMEKELAEKEEAARRPVAPVNPYGGAPPPTASAAPPPPPAAAALDLPKTPYELGVRVRGLFVTPAMMNPFLQASTGMESASVGLEFVYHRSTFDVVTSLDFSYLNMHDGNYLSVNHPAELDSHYVEFRNLSFLSADVSIIGHYDVLKWLQLRYGGGLGLGIVFGDVLLTNDFGGCTSQNASNLAQCHPVGVDLTSPQKEAQLKATEGNPPPDTAGSPRRHVSSDKPPVMGVVNILVGARFKLPKKFTAQVEVGFRDAIFVGAGAHYAF